MKSNGGTLQAAEGPIIYTNEERVDARNRSLVKRESRRKFMIEEKFGKRSPIKRDIRYIPFIGIGTFLHWNGYILPS